MSDNDIFALARRGYIALLDEFKDHPEFSEAVAIGISSAAEIGYLRALNSFASSHPEFADLVGKVIPEAIENTRDTTEIFEMAKEGKYRDPAMEKLIEKGKLDLVMMAAPSRSQIIRGILRAGEIGSTSVMNIQTDYMEAHRIGIKFAIATWARKGETDLLEITREFLVERQLFPEHVTRIDMHLKPERKTFKPPGLNLGARMKRII